MTAQAWRQSSDSGTVPGRFGALCRWAAGPIVSNAERTLYVVTFALFVAVRLPRIML
jgi:hypothetical protein